MSSNKFLVFDWNENILFFFEIIVMPLLMKFPRSNRLTSQQGPHSTSSSYLAEMRPYEVVEMIHHYWNIVEMTMRGDFGIDRSD